MKFIVKLNGTRPKGYGRIKSIGVCHMAIYYVEASTEAKAIEIAKAKVKTDVPGFSVRDHPQSIKVEEIVGDVLRIQ